MPKTKVKNRWSSEDHTAAWGTNYFGVLGVKEFHGLHDNLKII